MTLVICTRRRSDDFRFVVGRATADIDSALNRTTNLGPRTTNLHISSKKTAGQRSDLLREFVVHKRALMTNARCLTEGVDVPAIETSLLIRLQICRVGLDWIGYGDWLGTDAD